MFNVNLKINHFPSIKIRSRAAVIVDISPVFSSWLWISDRIDSASSNLVICSLILARIAENSRFSVWHGFGGFGVGTEPKKSIGMVIPTSRLCFSIHSFAFFQPL